MVALPKPFLDIQSLQKDLGRMYEGLSDLASDWTTDGNVRRSYVHLVAAADNLNHLSENLQLTQFWLVKEMIDDGKVKNTELATCPEDTESICLE